MLKLPPPQNQFKSKTECLNNAQYFFLRFLWKNPYIILYYITLHFHCLNSTVIATFYLAIRTYFPRNCKFISRNFYIFSRNSVLSHNCDFINHNSAFITCNCKFTSCNYEKKVTITNFFIQWWKRASIIPLKK